MTRSSHDAIDRREALRRATLLLGGAISAPTVAGVLAGCETRRAAGWTPRALTPEQVDLVATIAEHILPETDTPGARAVGVHRFIDAMLADAYPAEARERFVAGLGDVDALAQGECGRLFLQCTAAEQRSLLDRLDREAFAAPQREASPPAHTPTPRPFFRTMKELVVVGYYTSEIGATRELRHVAVPGRFEGCVPFPPNGRTWAV